MMPSGRRHFVRFKLPLSVWSRSSISIHSTAKYLFLLPACCSSWCKRMFYISRIPKSAHSRSLSLGSALKLWAQARRAGCIKDAGEWPGIPFFLLIFSFNMLFSSALPAAFLLLSKPLLAVANGRDQQPSRPSGDINDIGNVKNVRVSATNFFSFSWLIYYWHSIPQPSLLEGKVRIH
jgi:hypothetical protein